MSTASSSLRGSGIPLKPVEALALLVARLRDCAGMAERFPLQRELERIADELIAVRKAIMVIAETEDDPRPPVSAHDRRAHAKNPEPGMRICSKCRTKLPISLFTISDKRTGKLRADCKLCYNAGQRTRYVRAGYKIVTIEVMDGDPCVGHPCPVCNRPFEPGQRIQGDHLRHEGCRPTNKPSTSPPKQFGEGALRPVA
jgi:hypothetical protein